MRNHKKKLLAVSSVLALGLMACSTGAEPPIDPVGPVLTDEPTEDSTRPGDVTTDEDGNEYEILSIGSVRSEGTLMESEPNNFNRINMSADRKSIEVDGSGSSTCVPNVIDGKLYLDTGVIELVTYEPGPEVMCTADIMPFEQTITRHDDSVFPADYELVPVGSND